MAKRIEYEKLLETKFRWPMKGDIPFIVSDDRVQNARISGSEFTKLILMLDGYKQAADLMVEQTELDHAVRDMLVYPIIFNYRQYLELSLKYQLAVYGPTVGIEPNWRTHSLDILWRSFLEMLEMYGTSDPDDADPVVGEIILEYAKIDPGSYSYRYPVDRTGNPIPVAYNELHLKTLSDVMTAVENYFSGCDGYLDNLKDI